MFSPYYAWARGRGAGDPLNHAAINVALYGRTKRWTMTERRRDAIAAKPASLAIGPSGVSWDGAAFTVDIDEVAVPLPTRVRGTVLVHPAALTGIEVHLDANGRHRWRPLAPVARVEVNLRQPALTWSGAAYLDMNAGDEPLEDGFQSWTWSRTAEGDAATILYDVTDTAGEPASFAMRFDANGEASAVEPPPRAELAGTVWRVPRRTRADAGSAATVVETLEDAPFYARSLIATTLHGRSCQSVHESLSLDRFRRGWVKALLPFRMPRAFW